MVLFLITQDTTEEPNPGSDTVASAAAFSPRNTECTPILWASFSKGSPFGIDNVSRRAFLVDMNTVRLSYTRGLFIRAWKLLKDRWCSIESSQIENEHCKKSGYPFIREPKDGGPYCTCADFFHIHICEHILLGLCVLHSYCIVPQKYAVGMKNSIAAMRNKSGSKNFHGTFVKRNSTLRRAQ